MHHPTDRIVHTTAFVTPVVEHQLERVVEVVMITHIILNYFLLQVVHSQPGNTQLSQLNYDTVLSLHFLLLSVTIKSF